MTSAEMLTYFKERYGASGQTNAGKTDEELYLYLNAAVNYFTNTRYTGNNARQASFINDAKRVDDLRTLIKQSADLIDGNAMLFYKNGKSYQLPVDYRFMINVFAKPDTDWLPCDVLTPIQIDPFVESTYNKPVIENPKSFLESNSNLVILFDSEENIATATARMTYIKEPVVIDVDTDCDLPPHTHLEIIELAVLIAVEGVENMARVQTQDSIIDKRIE